MHLSSVAAKNNAKVFLKGKWPKAIGVCTILFLVVLFNMVVEQLFVTLFRAEFVWGLGAVPDIFAFDHPGNLLATLVSLLLGFFVYMPLYLGVARWFWRLTGGVEDPVGQVFYYFSDGWAYRRALGYTLGLQLRMLLASLVVYLPYMLVSVLTSAEVFGSGPSTALSILLPLTGLFSTAGTVLYLVYILRFFAAPFLLFSYEEESPRAILRLSARMSYGFKGGYFGFICSFIGWALLSVLVLPLLYVAAYFLAAQAIYCRYCINGYLRQQAQVAGAPQTHF